VSVSRGDRFVVRASLLLLRAARFIVPAPRRKSWLEEWEAEVRHRWRGLERSGNVRLPQQMDLLRRTSGSFVDAAWLRRQFTADAEIVHDLRHTSRLLMRQPGAALVAIATLALGIGATTTVFSVVNAVLVEALPLHEPERLVVLWERRASDGREREQAAAANLEDWREQSRTFEAIAGWLPWGVAWQGPGEPVEIKAARVSSNLFSVLGVAPLFGRTFHRDEETSGRDRVVVLGHRFWRERLAEDRGVIGRTMTLDGEPHEIVGVMPPGFKFPEQDPLVWVPLAYQPHELRSRNQRMFYAIGRLAAGVELPQAQAEMTTIARRLAAAHPRTNAGWDIALEPARDVAVGDARRPLLLLMGAVALVLSVACANVASLLLARGAARAPELAIRTALGAGRARLLRYLLVESLVLALAGGAAGVLAARFAVRAVARLGSAHLPPWNPVELDGRVLAFALGTALISSLLAGLVPGINSVTGLRLEALRGGHAGSRGATASRLTNAIVVGEMALSIVLLVGAGLLLRSFVRVLEEDPGFRPESLLSASIFLPDKRYPEDAEQIRFFAELLERVEALPGVVSVGATTTLPLNPVGIDHDMPFVIAGTPSASMDPKPEADFRIVSEGYFRTMGIPLLAGRAFDAFDDAKGRAVVIINRALADRFSPGIEPLGRSLYWGSSLRSAAEIVGVVGEVRHRGLDAPSRPEFYVSFRQVSYGSLVVVARTRAEPLSFAGAIKQQVFALDAGLPISDISSMDGLLAASLAARRFNLILLGVFAALALCLAAVGIYGVVSFTTALRTREFGVRLALGARPADLLALVLRDTLGRAAAGVALGTAAALSLGRLLEASLYGVGPADPVTLGSVAVLLALVAVACSAVPARRVARVDPVSALRGD
jgi:putative ABC transport system permease protein